MLAQFFAATDSRTRRRLQNHGVSRMRALCLRVEIDPSLDSPRTGIALRQWINHYCLGKLGTGYGLELEWLVQSDFSFCYSGVARPIQTMRIDAV